MSYDDVDRIEITTSAQPSRTKCIGVDDTVTIRIGFEKVTITAGEWARLISRPRCSGRKASA